MNMKILLSYVFLFLINTSYLYGEVESTVVFQEPETKRTLILYGLDHKRNQTTDRQFSVIFSKLERLRFFNKKPIALINEWTPTNYKFRKPHRYQSQWYNVLIKVPFINKRFINNIKVSSQDLILYKLMLLKAYNYYPSLINYVEVDYRFASGYIREARSLIDEMLEAVLDDKKLQSTDLTLHDLKQELEAVYSLITQWNRFPFELNEEERKQLFNPSLATFWMLTYKSIEVIKKNMVTLPIQMKDAFVDLTAHIEESFQKYENQFHAIFTSKEMNLPIADLIIKIHREKNGKKINFYKAFSLVNSNAFFSSLFDLNVLYEVHKNPSLKKIIVFTGTNHLPLLCDWFSQAGWKLIYENKKSSTASIPLSDFDFLT